MKPHNLNQVAVWLPMKSPDLDVKVYTEYPFTHKGIIQGASILNPVMRYAKNYETKDGIRFSLCLISTEKDKEKMESFMDKVAVNIKPDSSSPKFSLTDIYYK